MSNIEKIHDFFLDQIENTLPSYRRLSNPYRPEENPAVLLTQGYGLTIGQAQVNKRTQTPILILQRRFGVVLTREYMAREDDSVLKAETEKALLDDAFVLSAHLEALFSMDGQVLRSRVIGDSGLEFVNADNNRFLKTVIDFEVEYFEVGPCV